MGSYRSNILCRFLNMRPLFEYPRNVDSSIWRNLAQENSEMRAMSNIIFPFRIFSDPAAIFDFGIDIIHVFLVLGELNATI